MEKIAVMFTRLIGYLFNPSRESIAAGNIGFLIGCLCAGALAGSAMSIYLVSGIVYSAWHIQRGVVPWQKDVAAVATASAFAAYFFAELLSFLVNPIGNGTNEILSNLPFLGLFPLYSLIIVDRDRLLNALEQVATIVAVVGVLIVGFSPGGFAMRAELSTGNAGILAVVASVLYLINCIAVARKGHEYWRYALTGCAASAILVLTTGMRALWPCLIIVPIIVIAGFWRTGMPKFGLKPFAGVVAAILVTGALTSNTFLQRVQAVQSDLQAVSESKYSSSLGQRFVLWKAGIELIKEKPVFGHGPGSGRELIANIDQESGVKLEGYTHFHNAIINVMVRSGSIGLIALLAMFLVPLYFVLRAPDGRWRPVAISMLAGTQAAYVLSGMTGIMIGHDILDALFISVTAYCLYLVRPQANEPLHS